MAAAARSMIRSLGSAILNRSSSSAPDLEEVEVVVEGVERQLPAVDLRAGPRRQDGLQPLAPELEPVAQRGRESRPRRRRTASRPSPRSPSRQGAAWSAASSRGGRKRLRPDAELLEEGEVLGHARVRNWKARGDGVRVERLERHRVLEEVHGPEVVRPRAGPAADDRADPRREADDRRSLLAGRRSSPVARAGSRRPPSPWRDDPRRRSCWSTRPRTGGRSSGPRRRARGARPGRRRGRSARSSTACHC